MGPQVIRLAAAFVAGICVGAATIVTYVVALTFLDGEAS